MLISTPTASFTRPADTNAYSSGDLVANSTTAGSVVPMSFVIWHSNVGQTIIQRIRISKSGTSATNADFKLHLYEASPTIANGDNGAWSTSKALGYLGNIEVTTMLAFTDGCTGFAGATAGAEMRFNITSGNTLYGLLEARAAYTPASAEVFTVYLECLDRF